MHETKFLQNVASAKSLALFQDGRSVFLELHARFKLAVHELFLQNT